MKPWFPESGGSRAARRSQSVHVARTSARKRRTSARNASALQQTSEAADPTSPATRRIDSGAAEAETTFWLTAPVPCDAASTFWEMCPMAKRCCLTAAAIALEMVFIRSTVLPIDWTAATASIVSP